MVEYGCNWVAGMEKGKSVNPIWKLAQAKKLCGRVEDDDNDDYYCFN
jgi:hypothetical protein